MQTVYDLLGCVLIAGSFILGCSTFGGLLYLAARYIPWLGWMRTPPGKDEDWD